jgi:hypothetical protein
MEIAATTIDKVLTDLASQPDPGWKTLDLDKQRKQIQTELDSSAPLDGMMRVITRMQFQEAPDLGEIDWESELATFETIEYPQYYLQPFHSVLGGWLSETAAVGNRVAMEAVLENAHPQKSLGVRDEIAQLFPENARHILDWGSRNWRRCRSYCSPSSFCKGNGMGSFSVHDCSRSLLPQGDSQSILETWFSGKNRIARQFSRCGQYDLPSP